MSDQEKLGGFSKWVSVIVSGLKFLVFAFAIGFAAIACNGVQSSAPTPPAKPLAEHVPPTPLAKKTAKLGEPTWDPHWNVIVERALPPDLLSRQVPHDVQNFCPDFYVMNKKDKRGFWAYFFQALSGAEATLDPTAKAAHVEPKLAHKEHVPADKVMTEGLLQLTYDDSKRYDCAFNHKADRRLAPDDPSRSILRPKNNLQCGVKILANQIIDQHKPLVSPTSYWATLRPGTAGYRVFVRQMANPPKACELHAAHHRVAGSRTLAIK